MTRPAKSWHGGRARTGECERRLGASDSGLALIAVIMYLLIVTALSAAFFQTIHRTMAEARRAERTNQCLYLAEAGVDKALAVLRVNPSEYHGEQNTPLGQGVFSVEVNPGAEPGAYHILSIGRVTDGSAILGERRLEADVAFQGSRIARLREAEAGR